MAKKTSVDQDLIAALEETYFLVPKTVAKWLAPTLAVVLTVGGWSGVRGVIDAAKSAARDSAIEEAKLAATAAVEAIAPEEVQKKIDAHVAGIVASEPDLDYRYSGKVQRSAQQPRRTQYFQPGRGPGT